MAAGIMGYVFGLDDKEDIKFLLRTDREDNFLEPNTWATNYNIDDSIDSPETVSIYSSEGTMTTLPSDAQFTNAHSEAARILSIMWATEKHKATANKLLDAYLDLFQPVERNLSADKKLGYEYKVKKNWSNFFEFCFTVLSESELKSMDTFLRECLGQFYVDAIALCSSEVQTRQDEIENAIIIDGGLEATSMSPSPSHEIYGIIKAVDENVINPNGPQPQIPLREQSVTPSFTGKSIASADIARPISRTFMPEASDISAPGALLTTVSDVLTIPSLASDFARPAAAKAAAARAAADEATRVAAANSTNVDAILAAEDAEANARAAEALASNAHLATDITAADLEAVLAAADRDLAVTQVIVPVAAKAAAARAVADEAARAAAADSANIDIILAAADADAEARVAEALASNRDLATDVTAVDIEAILAAADPDSAATRIITPVAAPIHYYNAAMLEQLEQVALPAPVVSKSFENDLRSITSRTRGAGALVSYLFIEELRSIIDDQKLTPQRKLALIQATIEKLKLVDKQTLLDFHTHHYFGGNFSFRANFRSLLQTANLWEIADHYLPVLDRRIDRICLNETTKINAGRLTLLAEIENCSESELNTKLSALKAALIAELTYIGNSLNLYVNSHRKAGLLKLAKSAISDTLSKVLAVVKRGGAISREALANFYLGQDGLENILKKSHAPGLQGFSELKFSAADKAVKDALLSTVRNQTSTAASASTTAAATREEIVLSQTAMNFLAKPRTWFGGLLKCFGVKTASECAVQTIIQPAVKTCCSWFWGSSQVSSSPVVSATNNGPVLPTPRM